MFSAHSGARSNREFNKRSGWFKGKMLYKERGTRTVCLYKENPYYTLIELAPLLFVAY
jgi:hypothetical protein